MAIDLSKAWRWAGGALLAAATATSLVGQNAGQNAGQDPATGTTGSGFGNQNLQPSAGQGIGPNGQQLSEFTSIWSTPRRPEWNGFPQFNSRLQGYGNYPLPVNPSATGLQPAQGANTPLPLPLPPAEPEPPGWPSWIRTQSKKPLPFALDLGLLVGESGRVWHRDRGDEPFVPLFAHDPFATLPVGSEVEMRRAGSFELLLHQSSRLQTQGRTSLRTKALDEDSVQLELANLTWLRLHVFSRNHRLSLPDGSVLDVNPEGAPDSPLADSPGSNSPGAGSPLGASPSAATNPLAGALSLFGLSSAGSVPRPPVVEIERTDEPGWYGGRATITNLGGTDVVWTHAFGTTTISPDQRVTFFLSRPGSTEPAGFDKGDARIDNGAQDAPDQITCTASRDTEVRWCGASVRLPGGAKVTLDALGGDVLGPGAPKPAKLPSAPGN